MTKIQTVLFTGKTHTRPSQRDGSARASETRLDIDLSTPSDDKSRYAYPGVAPHPTAEQLFAGAWSACYFAAIEAVAKEKKVPLPPGVSIDVEVDVGTAGKAYFLQARLNIGLPGMAQEVAEALAHGAHEICPYSKATRGNIDVALNVLTA
ncbi:Ohr family peroxiredoxin [Ramlibacter montanisoli]|uniref:Ohr family peroxiredoxin n=1 Tax=Ramlibacter montanisoli TaxID=2732512 RepID=A0A849K6C9_9BURK|nr:Ohr family peroxiredoxin [Ramlibacter montanisoli]NNU41964.1 Ohr family peroxiredoxin [Ramlibacter montanisoli]